MPRAAVVVNPVSGSRSRAQALLRFARRLESGGYEVRVRPTERAGHGAKLAAEEAALGTDVVVAAGGDGTVNEVASGIVGLVRPPRLGLLPHGTSNLVARELDIPFDPRRAAEVVLAGHEARIDAARANGRLFVACLGVGWDAHVVRALAERRRGHIGFHSYLRPIAGALLSYRFRPLRVLADGVVVDGVFAVVFNTRPYAAYFRPVPEACCDDGLLDVVVMRRGSRRAVLRWMARSYRGTLGRDAEAAFVRAARVRIESDEPLPCQIDGDVGGETPVDIVVVPGALRVLRPAPRPDPRP